MTELNIAALMDDTAYTVSVIFCSNNDYSSSKKRYTYICNIPSVDVDSLVIVPVGNGPYPVMLTAQVVGLDKIVAITTGAATKYKWVAAKVDTTEYNKLADRNRQLEERVALLYQRNLRKSFYRRLLADATEEAKASIQALLGSK